MPARDYDEHHALSHPAIRRKWLAFFVEACSATPGAFSVDDVLAHAAVGNHDVPLARTVDRLHKLVEMGYLRMPHDERYELTCIALNELQHMPKAANDNCLEGYECPQCGSLGPFIIRTHLYMRWDDNGVHEPLCAETVGFEPETEFEDDAWCMCESCHETETTKDFKIKE